MSAKRAITSPGLYNMGRYLQTEEELATKTPRKNFGGHGVLKRSHMSRNFFLG
jgi:hypothetical protein